MQCEKPTPESPEDHRPFNVRALLQTLGTPFADAEYGPRAAIFLQGDPCDTVMHIEKGRVRLAVTETTGREAICGLLGAGAFLGEEALAGRHLRRETAIALTATEVLVVPKSHMIRLVRKQQAIRDRLLAHVLARNARLEADLTDQLFNCSERRLARALVMLAGCDDRRPCRCVLPDVSQELIAEMVGTTRSRVNVFMGKFKKLGLIEEDDGMIRVNSALLRALHDGDPGVQNETSREALPAPRYQQRYSSQAG